MKGIFKVFILAVFLSFLINVYVQMITYNHALQQSHKRLPNQKAFELGVLEA